MPSWPFRGAQQTRPCVLNNSFCAFRSVLSGSNSLVNRSRTLCGTSSTHYVTSGTQGSSLQSTCGDVRHDTDYDVETSAAASRYLLSSYRYNLVRITVLRCIRDKLCRNRGSCKLWTKHTASRRHLYTTENGRTVADGRRNFCHKIQVVDPSVSTVEVKEWGSKIVAGDGGNTGPVGLYGYPHLTSPAGFHQMGEDAIQR